MQDFDYTKLCSMMQFFSTDTKLISPAVPIKIFSAGIAHAYDPKIASHTGFIVKDTDDRLWAAEATADGFDTNSLRTYLNNGKNGIRIIGIRQLPVFLDPAIREEATHFILDLAYERRPYEDNLFKTFVLKRKDFGRSKLYCSEAVEFTLNKYKVSYNGFKNSPLSPYDEQKYNMGTWVTDYIINAIPPQE